MRRQNLAMGKAPLFLGVLGQHPALQRNHQKLPIEPNRQAKANIIHDVRIFGEKGSAAAVFLRRDDAIVLAARIVG
jgi:hypothetical protein